MREKEIKDEIRHCLDNLGVFYWNNWQGGKLRMRSKRGVPDIIGILPGGKFLGIEVKTKEGKLSKEQSEFMSEAQRLEAVCIVARSVDDVLYALNHY